MTESRITQKRRESSAIKKTLARLKVLGLVEAEIIIAQLRMEINDPMMHQDPYVRGMHAALIEVTKRIETRLVEARLECREDNTHG